PSLGDRIPIEMAQTDIGAREVEAVLLRMAHGVY
ncbi:antitoxin Xre/MbcA/ParS toxin-binding domain-containing protein, partial [Tabrizicola sp.]